MLYLHLSRVWWKKHCSNDDKFVRKGRIELVDLEDEKGVWGVCVSPEGNFVMYAGKKYLSYVFFLKIEIDYHFST